jgi:hypothetical protein
MVLTVFRLEVSQTHECGNLDLGRAIPIKLILYINWIFVAVWGGPVSILR